MLRGTFPAEVDMPTSVVWFTRDLRLTDNPALHAATEEARSIVPVYVMSTEPQEVGSEQGRFADGSASRAWLAASLASLDASLRDRGSSLTIRSGRAAEQLSQVCARSNATRVYCSSAIDPAGQRLQAQVREALRSQGIALLCTENAGLAVPLGAVRNSQGQPYRIFTPYHSAWRTMHSNAHTFAAPDRLSPPATRPDSEPLPAAAASGPDLMAHWKPGETGAHDRLARFERASGEYAASHDDMALDATSHLSPHLAFGEITPRQIMQRLGPDHEAFVRQLAWREFAYSTLAAFPDMERTSLRPAFERMPWIDDGTAFEAWAAGRTGVPVVDAGMRQLAASGWMHNRARMICASWLTKDLLVDWRVGQAHFARLLADADPALNAFNWQWVAGSGADAAPYFRIMNPVTQATRFDADGTYVRRWVPELERVPAAWVHRPWDAPEQVLSEAGVELGREYPVPVIDHAIARRRALDAYATIKPT